MKNPILSAPQPFDRNLHCERNYIQVKPGTAILIRDYMGELHVFSNNEALTRMQLWRFRKSAQVYTVTTSPIKIQVPLQACSFHEGALERTFDGVMNLEIKVTDPALLFTKCVDTIGDAEVFVSGITPFVRNCVMNNIFSNQRRRMQSVVVEFSLERHNALANHFEPNGMQLLHSYLNFTFKRDNHSAAPKFHGEQYTGTHRSANKPMKHANRNVEAEHKHAVHSNDYHHNGARPNEYHRNTPRSNEHPHNAARPGVPPLNTARPGEPPLNAAVKPVQPKHDADMKNEGFVSLEELMNKLGENSVASGS